jgi:hypothetical protein
MRAFITTCAIASILATSAVAKTERTPASRVEPDNSVIESSVTCGRVVLTDPDTRIRSAFLRDCAHHNSAN